MEPLVRNLDEVALEHRLWAQGAHGRVPLGFPIIDSRTDGGPAMGELVMFACRSGVGKTTFGCNVAVNNRSTPTLFFSLEMHARYILQRCAAIYSRTPTRAIERQVRAGEDCPAVEAFLRDFPLFRIVDEPGLSIGHLRDAIEEYADGVGERPRLVIIDYMELVTGGMAMSESGAMDKIARGLKNLARVEDVVVLVLHQTNVGGGDGEKPLTRKDLRYGGDVPADYTLAAYRPALNPALSWEESRAIERDFYVQFLKTRTSGGLALQGVKHDLDPETLHIELPGPRWAPAPPHEEET